MSTTDPPPLPESGEPDSDQLPFEDTLEHRATADPLEEGYSPPERPRSNHWGETPLEQALGEPLEMRLAQEEPEPWDARHRAPAGTEEDRTGRLTVDDDEDTDPTGAGSQHYLADDVGPSGGAASAEEAAMHVVADEDLEPPAEVDELPDDGRTLDDDDLGAEDEDER